MAAFFRELTFFQSRDLWQLFICFYGCVSLPLNKNKRMIKTAHKLSLDQELWHLPES